MNSKLKIPETSKIHTFPLLARIKKPLGSIEAAGTVVLFTSLKSGTVIYPSQAWPIGHHCNDWISIMNVELWELLPIGTEVVITA